MDSAEGGPKMRKRATTRLLVFTAVATVVVVLGVVLSHQVGRQGPKIGICQIASHPSLDAVREGAIAALAEAGFRELSGATLDVRNAEMNMNTAKTIADTFVQRDYDLIIPITTPMAQAVANATKKIPIVFGAVTDPVGAGIVRDLQTPGTNCTGISDLWPIRRDLELLKRICPNARSVGTIYNTGESNSQLTIKLIRAACRDLGLELREATVTSGSEVLGAAESLVGRVDAVFTAADSTVGAAYESIIKVAREQRIPLFAGDGDSVKRGAIGCYGADYYEVGRLTGELAARVLKGEDPARLPVLVITKVKLIVNPSAAQRMGVTLPPDLLAEADEVIGE